MDEVIKRCFVIGPMKDINRLNTLANKVILPLLQPYGFRVITPDTGETGAIMNQVLLNLEQADILIADITGNNPNVMYELGIYHSFGKPYIAVSEMLDTENTSREMTPFDIAAFRYLTINLNDVEFSKRAIEPLLTNTIEKMDERDWFENPVTVFYNSPVAEIPTAIGLFKNYCKNFLEQLLPDLYSRQEESSDYLYPVYVYAPENSSADTEGFVKLTNAERKNLSFELLIPKHMYMVEHSYIKSLKDDNPSFPYAKARVIKKSRPFYLHYRKAETGDYVLADFPTVLATLNESIAARRRMFEKKIEALEWKILERQELERFARKCELFKSRMVSMHPHVNNKFNVVWNWKFES
ncbi:MAG: nucleoside 2-deoxyribosyltransferase [Chitinophagaceae bacterium]|nr:nucleoside 2-deoxyribosyltransferase [Chitinophagaceae bacterium]